MGEMPQGRGDRAIVLSVMAWAIFAPFLIVAYGGFDQAESGGQWLAGFGLAVLVHLLLLVIFLAAGAVERRLLAWRWWRAAWIGLIVAGVAVGRPALNSVLHELAGIPAVVTPWWLRVLLNAAVLVLGLLVIHAVQVTAGHRAAVRARLDAVATDSAARAAATAASTARLVAEFEHAVAEPVRLALDAAVVRPFDASRQEESLRRVAHEVVRPLSHRVFEADVPEPPSTAALPLVTVVPTSARSWLASRILPAPIWAPVVVFGLVMSPIIVAGYGPVGSLVRMAAALLVAWLGCWGLSFVRMRHRGRQLAALVGGYLVTGVGLTVCFLDQSLLPLPTALPAIRDMILLGHWVYVPLAFTTVAMLIAIARSEFAEARELEADIAVRLLERHREAAAARFEHDTLRERLARVLHHQVQGEIVALALRLRLGSAHEPDVAALRQRIDRILAEAAAAAPMAATTPEVMARHAELAIAGWSRALEVRSDADPAVWVWLAARPEAAAVLLDAAVEGLTNAVRHVAASSARVDFARTGDGVRLEVRTPGRLRSTGGDGFGLADLRRRAARVRLEQDGAEVVLAVEVADG